MNLMHIIEAPQELPAGACQLLMHVEVINAAGYSTPPRHDKHRIPSNSRPASFVSIVLEGASWLSPILLRSHAAL